MILSAREIQVARLISHGRYEKEIADCLHIAFATVHAHTRNIRQKLNAGNIADITRNYIYNYDNAIRSRVRLAYYAGRRDNAFKGRDYATADQPGARLQIVWPHACNGVETSRSGQSGQTGFANILFAGRAVHGTQNQYDMTELQKIELLQWFYANLNLEQLETLKQIAKDLKNENTKRTRPSDNLLDAGKKN